MDNWILLAILAGLGSNLGSFLFRYILKEGDDATAYAWFHEVFRLLFFGIVIFFSFHLVLQPLGVAILIGLGIIEFIAVYLLMKMHAYSHLSISTIISRTRLIWVPILAFLLFRERLSSSEYIGIFIIFLGLSIATSPQKIFADKGLKYAYLSAFITALVNIFLKLSTPYANIALIMVFMSLPSVFLIPFFMKNGTQRVFSSLKINLHLKVMTGFVSVITMYLLTQAIILGPVGKVTALYQGMMLTSVLAGIFILHEREGAVKKILGSIVSLIGIILLTS